jgi:hypothetical protein
MAIILLAGLAALIMPPGRLAMTAEKPDNENAKPMPIHVGVTVKSHHSWNCTHTEHSKCSGCQLDGTATMDLDCKVKPNAENPLLYDVVAGGAHMKYDRHTTCPIDGETDSETGQSNPDAVAAQTAKGQFAAFNQALLVLEQVPWGMHYNLMAEGGTPPRPSIAELMAHRGIWNWMMILHVPCSKVRHALDGRERLQWISLALSADVPKTGASSGSVSWDTKGSPDSAMINLRAWKVEDLKGGTIGGAKNDGDWKITCNVGWRFGQPDMSVKITKPKNLDNFIFSQDESNLLRVEAEAEAKPKHKEQSIDGWRMAPVQGSEQEIKKRTASGESSEKPVKGPLVLFKFKKLPSKSDAFGNKDLICNDAEAVTVKVFFKKKEKDNPDGTDPNWFYYWKQGAVPGLDQFQYDDGTNDYGYFDPKSGRLNVGKNACETRRPYDITLFVPADTEAAKKRYADPGRKAFAGTDFAGAVSAGLIKPWYIEHWDQTKGVVTCHGVVLHENKHKEIWDKWESTGKDDKDGDGLPDWYEKTSAYRFDPIDPDTHFLRDQYSPTYASYGDQELLCRIRARDSNPMKNLDWAAPGCQTDPPE